MLLYDDTTIWTSWGSKRPASLTLRRLIGPCILFFRRPQSVRPSQETVSSEDSRPEHSSSYWSSHAGSCPQERAWQLTSPRRFSCQNLCDCTALRGSHWRHSMLFDLNTRPSTVLWEVIMLFKSIICSQAITVTFTSGVSRLADFDVAHEHNVREIWNWITKMKSSGPQKRWINQINNFPLEFIKNSCCSVVLLSGQQVPSRQHGLLREKCRSFRGFSHLKVHAKTQNKETVLQNEEMCRRTQKPRNLLYIKTKLSFSCCLFTACFVSIRLEIIHHSDPLWEQSVNRLYW